MKFLRIEDASEIASDGVVIFVDFREVAGLDLSAGVDVEINGFDVHIQVFARSLNGEVG